jgi:hypothetical protein
LPAPNQTFVQNLSTSVTITVKNEAIVATVLPVDLSCCPSRVAGCCGSFVVAGEVAGGELFGCGVTVLVEGVTDGVVGVGVTDGDTEVDGA